MTTAPAAFTIGEARLLAPHPVPFTERDRSWLQQALHDVRLLGRGGAAFPVAAKLEATRRGAYVVVNGTEGEPASWKDRVLMRSAPLLIVNGALVVARALRSRGITIAVTDDQSHAALRAAAGAVPGGEAIRIERTIHDFVGGEVNALLNGLSGRPVAPNGRRTLPTERGLHDQPTFASNAETFAHIALLAALGPQEYARIGTAAEPGTSLVTLLGDVPHPGVIELPNGTPMSRVVAAGRPMLIGGYHGTWTTAEDLRIERPSLKARGIGWGAGVVAVLPEDTCPIGEVARVATWLAAESIGQCGPCVFGLASIANDLTELAGGRTVDLRRLHERVGLVEGRGACRHPDGAARFVATAMQAFDADVRAHQAGGCGRTTQGVLPIGSVRSTPQPRVQELARA